MTALFDAIAAGDDDQAVELAQREPQLREHRDEVGLLPAMRALYERDRTLAEALLPREEALNVFEAAAFGRVERLQELLATDAQLARTVSPDGFTPLHLACFAGGAEATRLLLEHGADTEARSRHEAVRVPPLGTAAFSGDRDSARVLLEAGADPNGRGEGGFTALHSAAQNGDADFVRLLLEHGADATVALPDGRAAAELAGEAGHEDVAELLASVSQT